MCGGAEKGVKRLTRLFVYLSIVMPDGLIQADKKGNWNRVVKALLNPLCFSPSFSALIPPD